jgi:hypothetical protein
LNTPSHIIINAAIHKKVGRDIIPKSAFILGAFLPDFPLGVLTLGFFLYNRFFLDNTSVQLLPGAYSELFFNHPLWIASHNLLHTPLILGSFLVIFWRFREYDRHVGNWLFWFAVSASIHTAIDILTHINDGPLLFWPLDWQTRIRGLVSYHDPAFSGIEFSVFEIILDTALLLYLFLNKKEKLNKHRSI